MFTLAHFPPEILHLVLVLDHSYLTVRLYKCCNRLLNEKLEKCITEVSLRQVWCSIQKLPQLLFKLPKLRSLSLRTSSTFALTPDVLSILVTLHSTLEFIELNSTDAATIFAPSKIVSSASTPQNGDSSLIMPWPGAELLFPRLTTLKVQSLAGISISSFPATLTHLTIQDRHEPEPSFFSELPRSLKVLDFLLYLNGVEFESQLNAFAMGPPQLQYHAPLEINVPPYPIFPADQVDSWTSKLPEGVLNLVLNSFSPSLLSKSPRSLTSIDLMSSQDPSWAIFSDLYDEYARTGQIDSYWSIWPPNLLHFCIPLASSRALNALPRTLTSLNVMITGTEPMNLEELPLLKHFNCLCPQYGPNLLLGAWPHTLRELHTVVPRDQSLAAYPSHLTELRLQNWIQDIQYELPSSLTELHADNWSSEWFKLIPPHTTVVAIHRLTIVSYELDKLFLDLPSGLKRLSIRVTRAGIQRTLPVDSLSLLPLLESLSLSSDLKVPSKTLSLLPRSMTQLNVSVDLDDEKDLFGLPPLLSQCLLGISLQFRSVGQYWPLRSIADLPQIPRDRAKSVFTKRFKDLDY